MSVYRCNRCENIFDGDYEGCFEDLFDPTECLCEACSFEQDEEDCFKSSMNHLNELLSKSGV